MIISRYLFREISYILLALTTLLLLIYISHRFMAYLVQASMGNLPGDFIFKLLALRLLTDLMLILPLGFFLALLLALGRLYKDNEITALAACGIPVPIMTILGFGFIFSLIIGLLSLILAPWAESQRDSLRIELNTMAEVGGIAAGRFKEFNHGDGIFYVETIDTDNNMMYNIFVQVNLPNKRVIMVAQQGYQTIQAGELFMVLVQGHRYETEPGKLNYIMTKFAEHWLKVPKRFDVPQNDNRSARPTHLLWLATEPALQPALQAELQWRLSLPLSVILLAILAIPLSHTTPRQGQYAKIVLGILIYLIYNNLLNIATKWVEHGKVSPWIGVWWVHGGLLVIIIAFFNLSLLKTGCRQFFHFLTSFLKSFLGSLYSNKRMKKDRS